MMQKSDTMVTQTTPRHLSVITHNLQLDDTDLLNSVNRLQQSAGSHKYTPSRYSPPTVRKTAGRATRISLDDPDEVLQLTRETELTKKRNWIIPVLNLAAIISRFCSPLTNLNKVHPESRSFLAPSGSVFWIWLPVLIIQVIFVVACFTRLLRGTRIIQHGLSVGYLVSAGLGAGWQWTFGRNSGSLRAAEALAFLWMVAATATMVSVRSQKKKGLMGIWQHKARVIMKFRDYWFIELPMLCELLISFIAVIYTTNYMAVHEWLVHQPGDYDSAQLAERMLSAGITSLMFSAALAAFFFARMKKGNPVISIAATWLFLDAAIGFGRLPNTVQSPQLSWLDPDTLGIAMQGAVGSTAYVFLAISLISICLHLANLPRVMQGLTPDVDQRSHWSWLRRSFAPTRMNLDLESQWGGLDTADATRAAKGRSHGSGARTGSDSSSRSSPVPRRASGAAGSSGAGKTRFGRGHRAVSNFKRSCSGASYKTDAETPTAAKLV